MSVRFFIRTPDRTSYGADTVPEPYATYGAPLSEQRALEIYGFVASGCGVPVETLLDIKGLAIGESSGYASFCANKGSLSLLTEVQKEYCKPAPRISTWRRTWASGPGRRAPSSPRHHRRRPVFVQLALRWGRNWAAQWHLARAVGKRFRGCCAKRLYVYSGEV